MSKFINNAQEIELDGVGNGDDIVIYAISEHVETRVFTVEMQPWFAHPK